MPANTEAPAAGELAIVGFFNEANRDWRPPNAVAFQIGNDPVDGGGYYSVVQSYDSRDSRTNHLAYGGDDDPTGFRFGQT